MKWYTFILIVSLLIITSCKKHLTPEGISLGAVHISSTPLGAKIYIDGENTGKITNSIIEGIPAGKHEIKLTKKEYADAYDTCRISESDTAILNIGLKRDKGVLIVKSIPPRAKIYIDGYYTGDTTDTILSSVELGEHRITLRKDGFEDYKDSISIAKDETTMVEANLKLATGTFQITSYPTGAEVYLNGVDTGDTTNAIFFHLPSETTTVSLKKSNYKDYDTTVIIKENTPAVLEAYLEPVWDIVRIPKMCNGHWEMSDGIAVGDGRNDGTNRIYVAALDDSILEYTFDGSKYTSRKVENLSWRDYPRDIQIGDARNDGIKRVYVGTYYEGGGKIYEFTYKDTIWEKTTVYSGSGIKKMIIADGRNDGINRIYAECGSHIYEFTYTDTGWTKDDVGSGSGEATIYIGDGRNDGINRIYAVFLGDKLYEFTYSNGWVSKTIWAPSGITLSNITGGNGRNDGINRIYVFTIPGWIVYEFTFASNEWLITDTVFRGACLQNTYMKISQRKINGINRIYFTDDHGELYESTLLNNKWITQKIEDCNSYKFAIGDGRNDGVQRFYASPYTNSIYELTCEVSE